MIITLRMTRTSLNLMSRVYLRLIDLVDLCSLRSYFKYLMTHPRYLKKGVKIRRGFRSACERQRILAISMC
jgi:hypothetical protein